MLVLSIAWMMKYRSSCWWWCSFQAWWPCWAQVSSASSCWWPHLTWWNFEWASRLYALAVWYSTAWKSASPNYGSNRTPFLTNNINCVTTTNLVIQRSIQWVLGRITKRTYSLMHVDYDSQQLPIPSQVLVSITDYSRRSHIFSNPYLPSGAEFIVRRQ